MKVGVFILLLLGVAAVGSRSTYAAASDRASSANYQLTNVSLDGGGIRNGSDNYTNDVAISMIAVRALAAVSVVNNVGYTATLNNPPVAFDDVLSHPFDQPILIVPESFLQNDVDQDSDTLSVYGVDAGTEAHGSVAVNGPNFIYAPPIAFNGIDHFNYTVIDSGGDLAQGAVTMVIAPAIESQPIQTIAIYKLSDGSYLLRFRYNKGFSEYQIQSTPNLEQTNWQIVESIRAGGDGVASMIIQADGPRRFYRAVVF